MLGWELCSLFSLQNFFFAPLIRVLEVHLGSLVWEWLVRGVVVWRWCESNQGSSESANLCSRAKRSKRAELLTHFHASVKILFGKLFCHARVVPTCSSYLFTRHRVSKTVFYGTRTRIHAKCGGKTAHASFFLLSCDSDCFSRECENLSHPNLWFHFRSAF